MTVKASTNNIKSSSYLFKRNLVSIIVSYALLVMGASAKANESSYQFDPDLLLGTGQKVDINKFSQSNYVDKGQYLVNIFINQNFYDKKEIEFKLEGKNSASPCFLPSDLKLMGIIFNETDLSESQCLFLDKLVPGSTTHFDAATFRLNLIVPQVYIKQSARGFVPEDKLDSGETMLFANYDASYYKNKSNGYNSDYGFASLNGGFNLGLWQFRQQASFNYTSTKNNTESKFNWIRTYLQRPITAIQSQLLLGEISTAGTVFGSLTFKGLQLMSDDRMLPDSQKGYAPVIRGLATTAARVSVKQNGVEIYQTTVAPGEFEITDLYPTSYEGDLQVEVQEANGKITSFIVPFSAIPESVRPGHTRYALSIGEIKNFNRLNNRFIDTSIQHGLTNLLTLSTGIRVGDKYQAASLGTVVSTPLGAIGLQTAFSNADVNGESHQGARMGINYSRTLSVTNTIITLAGYKYSTEGFRELTDVLGVRGSRRDHQNWNSNTLNQESQFILHLNQSLGKWGQLFTTASINNYYGNRKRDTQFQLGYSTTHQNISYSLIYSQQKMGRIADNYTYSTQNSDPKTDKMLMFSVSLPLGSSTDAPMLMLSGTNSNSSSSYQANLSGLAGEDQTLSYSLNADYDNNDHYVGTGLHLTKQLPQATLSGNISKGKEYTQASMGMRGAIVAHSKGITVGPYISDTFALIEAPDAQGATVTNGMGASIDRLGYAIVPSLVPYKYNDIGLDSKGIINNNIELTENSQKIAPYSGANVKLTFKTSAGYPILISIPKSELLPLGAEVYDAKQKIVGLVGQGNQIYARVAQAKGKLFVDTASKRCRIAYEIPTDKTDSGLILLDGTCY
nr:fimbria/pilus outer membrane usher protein [uncultured Moellerella sp.]